MEVDDDDDAMDVDTPPQQPVLAPRRSTAGGGGGGSGGGTAAYADALWPLIAPAPQPPPISLGKVYRPVKLTEERPEAPALQYAVPTERTVMPPRARQTAMTVLPPGMHVRGASFLECVAHNNSWHAMSPEETLKHLAANELVESIQQNRSRRDAAAATAVLDKARSDTHYTRMATIDAGNINKMAPKNLSALTREELDKELHEQEVQFFMNNPLPSDDSDVDVDSDDDDVAEAVGGIGGGSSSSMRGPGDFPCLQRLYQVNGKAYRQRHETMRDASMAGHRDIEVVKKSHNDLMCQPLIGRTTFRGCSRGNACICADMPRRLGAVDLAYVCREYLTPKALLAWNDRRARGMPVSLENDGPIGLCYHDLKAAVSGQIHEVIRHKQTPVEPLNPFSVRVGQGEYAAELCWDSMASDTNSPTGISGRFPMHLNNCLQHVSKTIGGLVITYLAEVNADFQPRLSQANMCLGTSSPLGCCRRVAPPSYCILMYVFFCRHVQVPTHMQ